MLIELVYQNEVFQVKNYIILKLTYTNKFTRHLGLLFISEKQLLSMSYKDRSNNR